MIAGKVQYYVYVTTESGTTLNVTNAVTNLGWEENEKEISARVSFTLVNARYKKKKLSKIVKIGQLVTIKANWGAGSKKIIQAFIKEAEASSSKSAESYKITAYDCLFAMQKSQDNVFYKKGKKTKALITSIFGKWGIKLASYSGPNVTHAKVVYKNKNISDIILGILDEAEEKGGKKAIPRAEGLSVSIVGLGKNKEIYVLDGTNCIEADYKVSIIDLVTKVVIMASDKKSEQSKVEATMTKNTKYGVLQKIEMKAKSDSMSDAKKAAKKILDENSKPKRTRTIQCPDVPPVRKGDKVLVDAGSIEGEFLVKSIQHNADSGKMSMVVQKYSEA
jgi:hypothetical protein